MLEHEFHPLAAIELEEAVEHYESLSPGKGLELLQQVEGAIERIREFPESAPVTRGQIRSVPVQPSSRWKFTVHYRIKPTAVKILAVAHQARHPFYWFGRS